MNPLSLMVTLRSNLFHLGEPTYLPLGDFLKYIETDTVLKRSFITNFASFTSRGECVMGNSGESVCDDVMFLHHNTGENKELYRIRKKQLQVVHFSGMFKPPYSKHDRVVIEPIMLLVLDVDFKNVTDVLADPAMEMMEMQLEAFVLNHPNAVFVYKTSSTVGFHIGFLIDVTTDREYKQAYDHFSHELQEQCSFFNVPGVVDKSETVRSLNAKFFVNHTNFLRYKDEVEIFHGVYTDPPVETVNLPTPVVNADHKFPYLKDFRLFMAYKTRKPGVYFQLRFAWITMLYGLIYQFPSCFQDRILYWFFKLSELAEHNHQPEKDLKEFLSEQRKHGQDQEQPTGVEFIIHHLVGPTSERPEYTLADVEHYFCELENMDKLKRNNP